MSADSHQRSQSLATTGMPVAASATAPITPTPAAMGGPGVASRSETGCCHPSEQPSCCAQSEKSRCCGPEPTADGGCGCK